LPKTLQQQYEEHLKDRKITKEKIDSVIEKTEGSVADMHRPVVASKTAAAGHVTSGGKSRGEVGPDLTKFTYEYVKQTIRDPSLDDIAGYIVKVGQFRLSSCQKQEAGKLLD
jgi:hypothetical protein